MITLKTLKWSNLFSYGENNVVNFNSNPLTQIVGHNGHGKSSIALVLEEVLYNKNSKGIKKSDILNRNSKSKSYSIELSFDKDGTEYVIKTTRGTTQTVKLFKNDLDISHHTATATYKAIEELIGYDHKTFSQIVYQSSAASLEFLTATDSNRKKFLIDLLNLSKYVEIGEVFKTELKTTETESTVLKTKIGGYKDWLNKYQKVDLVKQNLLAEPEYPKSLDEDLKVLEYNLKDLESINKERAQNNKYKELLNSIKVEVPGPEPKLDLSKYTTEKVELQKTVKDCDAFIAKLNKLEDQCPTCMQEIDSQRIENIKSEYASSKNYSSARVQELSSMIENYQKELEQWKKIIENKQRYEEYHSLWDASLKPDILDPKELEEQIKTKEAEKQVVLKQIKEVQDKNAKITSNNAKIDVIVEQLKEVSENLTQTEEQYKVLQARINNLQILVKAFSNTGLVAYKIECLVKDLEEITNSYLTELSDGRFYLSFQISSGDKLNVVITDAGKDIEISALSGGERARVNAAALLGIRKLMQSLSNSRINLLILDETIENLDVEGKEKLIDVLLQEEYLNTFIISHGFQHPLLEKLQVIKKNNISRIENG